MHYTVNSKTDDWTTTVPWIDPAITLPKLDSLEWKYVNSLPEIQPDYNDALWVTADRPTTNNTVRGLMTTTSSYASDYGFHSGSLLYRGHFTAAGNETNIYLNIQGGFAFGSSVWLNQVYLGSWAGVSTHNNTNATYQLPQLESGSDYVLTILLDYMGLEESGTVGADKMKTPRGVLDYRLSGRDPSSITWKLTGNLGGETYRDRVRGPLNEGRLFAERQGWHLPFPPSQNWISSSPFVGIPGPGVGFYSAQFDLDMPQGWDIPLSFTFGNSTFPPPKFRLQL